MKGIKRTFVTLLVAMIAIIVWNSCTYSTREDQYTVLKQFEKISRIDTEAGLHFNIPFIQKVSAIPKSKQLYDLPKSDVITSDKKTMIVDAYVLWKVVEPKTYTTSLNANKETAEGRIDVIVYNAIKNTISNMTQEELIISRDDVIDVANAEATLDDVEINDIATEETGDVEVIALSEILLEKAAGQCGQYGIQIEKIDVKVLDLPEENKAAVYERMITERNNIAAAYIAQGDAEAQKIKNTTDKEVAVTVSEAQAQADKTIAEGEAEYMKILSNAYNDADKADFYLYSRALDTAKASLTGDNKTLFLDADSPIAQIFNGAN